MFDVQMERLAAASLPMITLDIQYRMHPAICMFPNETFYDSMLRTDVSGRQPVTGFKFPHKSDPVAFVNVEGYDERVDKSYKNPAEVDAVIQATQDLRWGGSVRASEISILTPYSGQVDAINDALEKNHLHVRSVSSVDKAQGDEVEVVLFSLVRCNNEGDIGFVSNSRRLSVGMTRAKRALILFGCQWTLTRRDILNLWNPLFRFFGERGWIRNPCSPEKLEKPWAASSKPDQSQKLWVPGTRLSTSLKSGDQKRIVGMIHTAGHKLISNDAVFSCVLDYILGLDPKKYNQDNQPSRW